MTDDTSERPTTDQSPPGDADPPDEGDDEAEFLVEGLTITNDGKVIIPSRQRDLYDVETGDVVDIYLWTNPGVAALDLVVGERGEVTIPARKRDIYGIEPGDSVDVTVRTTPHSAER